jgi:hypothetical protein
MEYPTLFTCGTRLFATADMHSPEGVTVHEAGHQFWYGLVGNNEFESSWLDEGFNSYTDSEVLWRVYGPARRTTDYLSVPHSGERPTSAPGGGSALRVLTGRDWSFAFLKERGFLDALSDVRLDPLRASGLVEWWRDQPLLTLAPSWEDPRWSDRSGYVRDAGSDPIETHAWEYVDRGGYRTNSYPRTALALRSLAGVIGRDAFLRGMRHYSGEWRYRHPYPADFYAGFEEGAGVDVAWYFEDAFRSTKTIDWSVEVSQERVPKELGWFPGAEGEYVERASKRASDGAADDAPEPLDDASASVADEPAAAPPAAEEEEDEEEADEKGPERPRRVDILLRRTGELCLPLQWQVRIEADPDSDADEAPPADAAGDEVREFVWTRDEQLARSWHRMTFELPPGRRVKSVVLDPERVYYFDRDMSDNQWFAERDRVAPLRWAERVLYQYQHLLHWFAGIGG